MIDQAHSTFLLTQARAGSIRHSGRTLYAHLSGTHDLLEAWGNPKPVCDAGLFHSIYGTNKFRKSAWPTSDRATIKQLIGPDAELLVYLFFLSDRPKVFFPEREPENGSPTLRRLREIEAANLLEQRSKSRWLQRLLDSNISDGAKRAIAQRLTAEEATAVPMATARTSGDAPPASTARRD